MRRGFLSIIKFMLVGYCSGPFCAQLFAEDFLDEAPSTFRTSTDKAFTPEIPEIGSDTNARAVNDPGKRGPYQIQSYTEGLRDTGYSSAIIYYPANASNVVLPATTLAAGYTNTKENISWLAQHLASHGIITIVFTPNNSWAGNAQMWAEGHKASIRTLIREHEDSSSPIANRVNLNRLGLMGYSFGGAGSILAANELVGKVHAAVPLCAYLPVVPRGNIPVMFLTGTKDNIATSSNILRAFNAMNTEAPKAYVKIKNLDHFAPLNRGKHHEEIAHYVTAWLQVYLADEDDYLTFLNGEGLQKQFESGIFAKASDFIFEE